MEKTGRDQVQQDGYDSVWGVGLGNLIWNLKPMVRTVCLHVPAFDEAGLWYFVLFSCLTLLSC